MPDFLAATRLNTVTLTLNAEENISLPQILAENVWHEWPRSEFRPLPEVQWQNIFWQKVTCSRYYRWQMLTWWPLPPVWGRAVDDIDLEAKKLKEVPIGCKSMRRKCTFTVLPALSTLCQTHTTCSKMLQLQNHGMTLALSHTLVPTSGSVSPKTSGTHSVTQCSFKSKFKTFLFSEYFS